MVLSNGCAVKLNVSYCTNFLEKHCGCIMLWSRRWKTNSWLKSLTSDSPKSDFMAKPDFTIGYCKPPTQNLETTGLGTLQLVTHLKKYVHVAKQLKITAPRLYLRVPSKRVAMASRKVFCGARRPFITGILTQMWDGQQLAGSHTISEAQQVTSRGSRVVQETLSVTVQWRTQGHTFTAKAATFSPGAMPLCNTTVQPGKTKIAHSNNAEGRV